MIKETTVGAISKQVSYIIRQSFGSDITPNITVNAETREIYRIVYLETEKVGMKLKYMRILMNF